MKFGPAKSILVVGFSLLIAPTHGQMTGIPPPALVSIRPAQSFQVPANVPGVGATRGDWGRSVVAQSTLSP